MTELERMERALRIAAELVVLDGPVYACILERLDREVRQARESDPVARAEEILRSAKR